MKSYIEAKREIERVGYANVGHDANILSHAEILSNHFNLKAMGGPKTSSKKIYLWIQKYNIDSSKLLRWVINDKSDKNLWVFWGVLLDDKDLNMV